MGAESIETTPLWQEQQDTAGNHDASTTSTFNSILRWHHIQDFCRANSFVLKVILVICIAKLYPPLGAIYLHPEITATWIAVMFIFLMAGICLKSNEFVTAATSLLWFNTFVLAHNFGVVSLIVFGLTTLIRDLDILPKGLTDGMVVCACMPVTVTMVIVLSKSAHGSEVAAVMLAAVGSLLSVVVTPALLLLYIGVQSDVSFLQVTLKLVVRVVLPLLVGQLLQLYCPPIVRFVAEHKPKIKGVQENVLVFIVYTVFCKTFLNPIKADLLQILWMALFQGFSLVLVMIVAWFLLKCFFRNQPQLRVTGFYGCTQKSVAVGIPMISAVYEHDANAGLYTLPLLIWHPLQLIIGCALAPHLARGVDRLEAYNASGEDARSSLRQSFFASSTSIRQSLRRASIVAFEDSIDIDNDN